MLARRNRGPPKTEPTPFAARAKDLGALRDAVADAGGVGTGLWLSYLFVLFYFAIAAGAVTHRDLFLENPVKLPFLNVELPLKAFFVLGPLVFLIVHAYVLLHFVLLAGRIGAFNAELQAQIPGDEARARLRQQLPSNIFVQSLAGPRDVRTGVNGILLRLVIQISLVAAPIALLVLFQLQFLPYHSEWVTSWQRIAVVFDLVLLWLLWPPIARSGASRPGWSDFKRGEVWAWAVVGTLPVLLVVTIATFPGEWLEENLPALRFIPTAWPPWKSEPAPAGNFFRPPARKWASLHDLLVAGEPDFVAQRPSSLWSNVLVLPKFAAGDRVKFDANGKISVSSDSLSLRGRSLEGAVLVGARLGKVDFTGARLQGANLADADLREAKFDCDRVGAGVKCTQLQGASLDNAQLQGASLNHAQLQGASLIVAQLQGASLEFAQLQGAELDLAHLQGSSLAAANLQGASLYRAQLQGASLHGAKLQGAVLNLAELQGADIEYGQLQGAWLWGTQLQGARLDRAQLQLAVLDYAQLQGASLQFAQLQGSLLRGDFTWRATLPNVDAFAGAIIENLQPEPVYQHLDCKRPVCQWSVQSYSALKSLIEQQVPGGRRAEALSRIESLAKPPGPEDEALASAWRDIQKAPPSREAHYRALAEQLKKIGCAAEGAPFVISGLIRHLDDRFQRARLQAAAVAATFLDEAKCAGARGLSETDKAKLREVRASASKPSSPGSASGD